MNLPKHYLQENQPIEALKAQGFEAIKNYTNNRKSNLGFFTKTFDYNRGLIRKDKYKTLLKHAKTSLEIYIIYFALLGDHSGGAALKKEIRNQLGYQDHSTNFVLLVLRNLIHDHLASKDEIRINLNENYIPNIINWVNNNQIDDSKNRPKLSLSF